MSAEGRSTSKRGLVTGRDLGQRLVVPLFELRKEDAHLAGAKAARLGELAAHGFPVPDGFVVTTAVHSDLERLDGTSVGQLAIPARVETAIRDALSRLGGDPVAVRSSAVGEDGSDASFAGQFDTVLDARGIEAVLAAVQKVWASAFGERATAYRRERGIAAQPMAVLVQRMVRARAAGVAFTANPVTGARDETLVSAVKGLGERLVSGEATPDEWRVWADRAEATSQPEQAISAAEARSIAALARRIEEHFGEAQDIEWALDASDTLVVLQARPVTAIAAGDRDADIEPIPIPIEVPPGSWERESAHNPDPPSPLYQVIFERMVPGMVRNFSEAGLLGDGIEFSVIGGRAYQRVIPLGGKDQKEPPAWLLPIIMPILRRVVPALRRRIARCVRAVRDDEYYQRCQWWMKEGRAELMAENADRKAIDLRALTDQQLAAELDRAVEHACRAIETHVRFIMGLIVVTGECVFFARRVLGWSDDKILGLFSGTSELSSAPGRALAKLAELADGRPAVLQLLADPTSDLKERLADADPDFATRWAGFFEEYGCRAFRHDDITEPTVEERPDLLASLVLAQLRRGCDFAAIDEQARRERESLMAEARDALASRPDDLAKLERLVERARAVYPMREDNAFHTQGVPVALWRRVAIEIGRRLATRGDIEEPDDVIFLRHDEAMGALGSASDRRALVRRRKGERKWAERADLPASFGPPIPSEPPPMGWMPEEPRLVMESFLWMLDRVSEAQTSARRQSIEGGGIEGVAASGGRYEGIVRVVTNEREFHKIEPGDVLVCIATSPVWSVLFPVVGALVTDAGGILSHQAIIAREHRVPAVVATGNATELLHDGQRVIVDGSRGRVEVIS